MGGGISYSNNTEFINKTSCFMFMYGKLKENIK